MTSTEEAVRELRLRLPHISEWTISHFLSKGNSVEECYEKLRDGKYQLPSSPEDRQYAFASNHSNASSSPPMRRHTSHPTITASTHDHYRPQHSDNHTDSPWRRGSNESASYRQAPPSPRSHRLSSSDFQGATFSASSPTRTTPLTELVAAQQDALDDIIKIRDQHIRELSRLKEEIQRSKEELSELRVKVSKVKSYHEDMANNQDLITTIRFDINDKKKNIAILKSQVEMKTSRDVYTEEGIRWQCGVCGFLNHPLLPNCEQCSKRSSR